MYINETKALSYDNKCENCKHVDICKYVEKKKASEKIVEGIPNEISSPFYVSVSCRKYEKKASITDTNFRGGSINTRI